METKELIEQKEVNNLTILSLLEKHIAENGANPKFNVPFLSHKNKYNVELQNWKDYQDLKKGIITIRQSGIRIKSPDYYPCLTHNPVIPIIYDNGYRYLNKQELLELQSFPTNYQFPVNHSLTKIASLLGNSINLEAAKHFLKDKLINHLKFVDLFAGIGGFHLVLQDYGKCVLGIDKNKSCAEAYQLNFPTTPFLLGDINNKAIQQKVCQQEFDLLCVGFPCQPFSKANSKNKEISPELTSLLKIIQKKQPKYLLLENVPNFLLVGSSKFLLSLLKNYHLELSLLNPKDLGIKQNWPRLFIWGTKVISNN